MGKTDEVIWDIINGQSYKKISKSFIFRCSFNFHIHVYNYVVPNAKGLQNVLYSTKLFTKIQNLKKNSRTF